VIEKEHYLICLAEECNEVGQRVHKALRFGLMEVQAGQNLTNAERIVEELKDLLSVAELLYREGMIDNYVPSTRVINTKEEKIKKFFAISREQGTLTDG
jgi:NTP pyrophosphatase (non-canonical NTP hydrolase)